MPSSPARARETAARAAAFATTTRQLTTNVIASEPFYFAAREVHAPSRLTKRSICEACLAKTANRPRGQICGRPKGSRWRGSAGVAALQVSARRP
jgi:hypothetical protein